MAEKKGYNRRDFLKIVGVSSGVAATGCGKDLPEKLLPYVVQPDEVVPGIATWYSGSCNECSAGCGVLVRTREGRVLKVEGNPSHPVNRGGLCAIGQSSVQGLYDPDRLREPLKRDVNGAFRPITWKEAADTLSESILASSKGGKEVALITSEISGSTEALVKDFLEAIPGSSHQTYSLFSRASMDKAAEESFGSGARLHFDFSKADVVVNFGADYLETWLSPVEFAKDFSQTRAPSDKSHSGKTSISKVFHIEPRLSLTAANSDRWVKCLPGSECLVLEALYRELGGKAAGSSTRSVEDLLRYTGVSAEVLKEIVEAVRSAKGRSVILAGGSAVSGPQVRRAHLLANAINSDLGNVGKTVLVYRDGKAKSVSDYSGLLALAEKCNSEKAPVGVVIFSGVNPSFQLPEKSGFKEAISKVALLVCHSSHLDETAKLAHLVLPKSTSFESWGDSEPLPGVFNLNQPAMQPLYKTESLGDLLIAILANSKINKAPAEVGSFYDYLKNQWKKRTGDSGFESRWLSYVERGGDWSNKVAPDSSAKAGVVKLPEIDFPKTEGLSLLAFPTVHFGDGSPTNRPWMQEIPDPLTSSVWGSWIEIHPDTAAKYHLESGAVAQVKTQYGAIEAPVYLTTHIRHDTVAVPIGLGRTAIGRYSNGIGANPLAILPPESADGGQQFVAHSVELVKSVANELLVLTHGHDYQEGRGIIRTVPLAKLASKTEIPHAVVDGHQKKDASGHGHGDAHENGHGEKKHHDPLALGPLPLAPQMYKQIDHPVYRWGMSVDLSRCTGCSACVAACYAENNVPVVGKDMVNRGREMSWIRIERYFDGSEEQPVKGFLPMMCQHCANAPCEPVCPVYATYHSDEGLNTMVYNRCVGTRYCSNNCSYKVRRFNWWKFSYPTPLNWQLNPDVTQREIGVMEKCTFCIQRIREVQNVAKNEGRLVRDGEVQPACASSCPTNAIVFGNLLDEKSKVHENSQDPRVYRILQVEVNTQPAVHYLAKVTHEQNQDKDSHHA